MFEKKPPPDRIITRAEAKAAGEKWYFTGKPCGKGHIDWRFCSCGKCMSCARIEASAAKPPMTDRKRSYNTLEEFFALCEGIFKGKYRYTKAVYVDAHTPMIITCPEHGDFKASPTNHLQGKGCKQCGTIRTANRQRKDSEQFIIDAIKVWGKSFDYSLVDYSNAKKPVRIICRLHPDEHIKQQPSNHLGGQQSCPKCNHMKSSKEDEVFEFLSIFTTVIRRNRSLIAPKELDIVLPLHKLAVEFDGVFWHSYGTIEMERKNKHKSYNKYKACQDVGYRLITIKEDEWDEHKFQIKRLLRCALGKLKGRVMARKCSVGTVQHSEAAVFFDKYHPQGGAGSGENYGLYWKDKLVACMRFTFGGNDRGYSDREWTLSRFATRVQVVGAASKLFSVFIKEHSPIKVKSFSDNSYFSGSMYEKLGFRLEEELTPDYRVWSKILGIRPKSHYQRRYLQQRLKEHGMQVTFDHATDPRTEQEITYLMGARRLYDCGKKRWVWTPNSA